MILTGPAIAAAITRGDITIHPYDPRRLTPNAYDWRLSDRIQTCHDPLDAARPTRCTESRIPATGMLLRPGVLYLGLTLERTCSDRYAQLLNGNRTIGALGIWVHVSAPLGHTGHAIAWTLEIRTARPVRVYPGMTFGKLVFLHPFGAISSYQQHASKYASSTSIDTSHLYREIAIFPEQP
ncbi:dCTP deaminase [Nonomuraea sp. KM90]|uniref:dCTP deaminase n=1 Tax=Nonomuraea sp. KM90 TaxID=3457428 RepID=UPI003FCDC579